MVGLALPTAWLEQDREFLLDKVSVGSLPAAPHLFLSSFFFLNLFIDIFFFFYFFFYLCIYSLVYFSSLFSKAGGGGGEQVSMSDCLGDPANPL